MPDISKCDATLIYNNPKDLCPLREKCYRYLVKPNIIQVDTKFGYYYNKQHNDCDYFWGVDSEEKK